MAGAIASFSLMAVAGREVAPTHDTFEILLYRSIVSFLIVMAVSGATGTIRQINARNLGLHLLRNGSHFIGQNLWFFALVLIPLAQVIALEFTAPIWVALLAPLVLGERLTWRSGLAALVGFAGVLVVVRPGLGTLSPAMLAALGAAVCFAFSALFTRKLTRTTSITCIMFWLTVMQGGLGLLCAAADGQVALPSAPAVPWLLLIGLTGLSGHFCLSKALSLAPATIVMPMDFVRLPVMALAGLLLYREPIDLFVILGSALIFSANWLNLEAGRRPGGSA